MIQASAVQALITDGERIFGGRAALARVVEVEEALLRRACGGNLEGWTAGGLSRLADALGVDEARLWLGAGPAELDLLATRNNSWGGVSPLDEITVRRALERSRTLRALGWPQRPLKAVKINPRGPSEARQGYAQARKVRDFLRNEAEPIPNLTGLVEQMWGILVLRADLVTPRVEAVAAANAESDVILLDREANADILLSRRNIAHELCHLLFDPRGQSSAILKVDEAFSMEKEPEEKRANAFAAELLVPKAGLIKLFGEPARCEDRERARQWVAKAAAKFGAPVQLTAFHLCNHQFLSPSLLEDPGVDAFLARPPRAVPWSETEQSGLEAFVQDKRDRELVGFVRALDLVQPLPSPSAC